MLTTEFCGRLDDQRGNWTSNESKEQGAAMSNFRPTGSLAKQFVQQWHKGHPSPPPHPQKKSTGRCVLPPPPPHPDFESEIALCQPYFARIAVKILNLKRLILNLFLCCVNKEVLT